MLMSLTWLYAEVSSVQCKGRMRQCKGLSYSSFLLMIVIFSHCWTVSESTFANPSLLLRTKQRKSTTLRPERSVEVFKCSRASSRLAHRVLEEYLLPFVEKQKFSISPKCKLHGSRDMFLNQEKLKIESHPNRWKCGNCSKFFKAEVFLDKHFDNRHASLVEKEVGCFADLCPLIHCGHCEGKKSKQKKSGKCKQADMDKRRHLCEALAEQCFPASHGSKAAQLNEFFRKQFCEAHTCDKSPQVFPLGSLKRKYESLYYGAIIFLMCFLAVFYGTIYFQERSLKSKGDLRRLQPKGSLSLLNWGFLKKDKQY